MSCLVIWQEFCKYYVFKLFRTIIWILFFEKLVNKRFFVPHNFNINNKLYDGPWPLRVIL